MKKIKIAIFFLLLMVLFTLTACQNGGPDATNTPSPAPTASPVPEAYALLDEQGKALVAAAEAAVGDYSALSASVAAALPDAYNAEVPIQNAQAFVQAVMNAKERPLEDEVYKLSLSSGGDFIYDKPYASATEGKSTETHVVSDTDEPYEEVEVIYNDPLAYVLSGQGGGEFSYASYYLLGADGKSGEYEKVSRLNDAVTGYSHYSYSRTGDTLYFADAQLSLELDQTAGPFTWVLLIGEYTPKSIDLFEFSVQTSEMSLPDIFPSVREEKMVSVETFAAKYRDSQLSRLTVQDGKVSLTNDKGVKNAQLK